MHGLWQQSREFFTRRYLCRCFQKNHVISRGEYRKKCICQICGASDRERWLLYVLQNIIHISHISGRVLLFALEMHIISIIKIILI
jgi:hypothetical protein